MSTTARLAELRRARVAAGMCRECTAPQEPGYTRCTKHCAAQREHKRETNAVRKSAGLCRHCKEAVVPGLTMCQRHRELHNGKYYREFRRKHAAELRVDRLFRKAIAAIHALRACLDEVG